MKVKITQEGMVGGKWKIEHLDGPDKGLQRSPYASYQDALDKAQEIAKHRYGEVLELV